MGGTYEPSNVVELTREEHAEAHQKLYEKYGNREDLWAANMLGKPGVDISGEANPMWNRSHKQTTKEEWSRKRKGVKQTEEHIAKRVAKNTGQKRSAEQKRKLALGQIDNPKAPTLIIMKCEYCGREMNMPNLVKHQRTTCNENRIRKSKR